MNLTPHLPQLQDAVALLAFHMKSRSKGSVTFHFDGQGNIGDRVTVEITSTLKGQHKPSCGIEVSTNHLRAVAADREQQRATTTTTTARTSNQPDGESPSGGTSDGEKLRTASS